MHLSVRRRPKMVWPRHRFWGPANPFWQTLCTQQIFLLCKTLSGSQTFLSPSPRPNKHPPHAWHFAILPPAPSGILGRWLWGAISTLGETAAPSSLKLERYPPNHLRGNEHRYSLFNIILLILFLLVLLSSSRRRRRCLSRYHYRMFRSHDSISANKLQ